MFKKLILVLVLVLALALPALACVVPVGTVIWGFTGPAGAVQKMTITREMPVVIHPNQHSTEMLASFNEVPQVVENWLDGKVVTGPSGMNYLVHEEDVKCE